MVKPIVTGNTKKRSLSQVGGALPAVSSRNRGVGCDGWWEVMRSTPVVVAEV